MSDRCQRICDAIEELRNYKGDSLTILCDNPDFDGQPNNAIECNGDWTDYEDRRFTGDSLVECLESAAAEKRNHQVNLQRG